MNENIVESRLKNFKKGVDQEEGRRRREETQLNLRKQKKNERLTKRRLASSEPASGIKTAATVPASTDLPRFVKAIQETSGPVDQLLEGVVGIRKMLSVNQDPPVKEVVDAGALKSLVEILMRTDAPKLQMEAAWALTNVASSIYTSSVADIPNAIDHLVKLLCSFSPEVREQSAWCLANIAGDCPDYRDEVLKQGAMSAMIMNIQEPANESLLTTVVWAVSNLCRGKPQPDLSLVAQVIQPLFQVIENCKLDEVLIDALWALSYISDGSDNRIDSVLKGGNGFTEHLAKILVGDKPKLIAPALRILGNFASGSEVQTQAVIDAGVLDVAPQVLDSPKKNIQKEMCWLLSNITAGTQKQIGSVLRVPKLVEKMVQLSIQTGWETRKEAVWAVSNACTGGSDSQVIFMVGQNAIEAMVSILDVAESRIVVVGLEAIINILTVSERENQSYPEILDEIGGLDKIEQLQSHGDNEVYKKTLEIIERFFGEADNNEDENIAPSFNADAFSFGMSPPPAKNLFNDSVSSNSFAFGHHNGNQMKCED